MPITTIKYLNLSYIDPLMNHTITPRHFVHNTRSADNLRDKSTDLLESEILKKYVKDNNSGLFLHVDYQRPECIEEASYIEDAFETVKKLERDNITVIINSKTPSASSSFRKLLFGSSQIPVARETATLFCLDQHFRDPTTSAEQILEYIERVKKDNILYSVFSRDVPVVLASNKGGKADMMRQIHELFLSLAIQPEKLYVPGRDNVSRGYDSLGETCSGGYILNHRNPNFQKVMEHLSTFGEKTGFSAEFFTALVSAEIGRVSSSYVGSEENPFYSTLPEREEEMRVEDYVRRTTTVLYNAFLCGLITRRYFTVIQDRASEGILSGFYDINLVLATKKLMLSSFSE